MTCKKATAMSTDEYVTWSTFKGKLGRPTWCDINWLGPTTVPYTCLPKKQKPEQCWLIVIHSITLTCKTQKTNSFNQNVQQNSGHIYHSPHILTSSTHVLGDVCTENVNAGVRVEREGQVHDDHPACVKHAHSWPRRTVLVCAGQRTSKSTSSKNYCKLTDGSSPLASVCRV